MADRKLVAEELSKLFSALSHPDRIRIVEELGVGEQDVQTLSKTLEISSSRVSQHLSTLRALRLVQERREGKHHFYSLAEPMIAAWILEGLKFSELGLVDSRSFDKAVKRVMRVWSNDQPQE